VFFLCRTSAFRNCPSMSRSTSPPPPPSSNLFFTLLRPVKRSCPAVFFRPEVNPEQPALFQGIIWKNKFPVHERCRNFLYACIVGRRTRHSVSASKRFTSLSGRNASLTDRRRPAAKQTELDLRGKFFFFFFFPLLGRCRWRSWYEGARWQSRQAVSFFEMVTSGRFCENLRGCGTFWGLESVWSILG